MGFNLLINVIFLLLLFAFALVENTKIHVSDMCGYAEGRRLYLELGEKGILHARYVNNTFVNRTQSFKNASSHSECSLEFVTCISCVVKISFRYFNVSDNCEKIPMLDFCSCQNVWIYEPQYEDVSVEHFCGRFIRGNSNTMSYVSKTRRLKINFSYYSIYDHVFTLDYISQRNKVTLTGQPSQEQLHNSSQVISSPFFPNYYPSDLNVEYTITCKTTTKSCKIKLIFTDFRISLDSILEVFDWRGQRMYVATGNVFRPSILVSSGPSLVVKFYANGGSNHGYKATYSFIDETFNKTVWKPDTNCGGYVTNLGGAITMMNMVQNGTRTYDCIWILRPPNNYMHMKTHLYVKVAEFIDLEAGSELKIHPGLTSDGAPVEVLRNSLSKFVNHKPKEHIAPLSQGFYIRLRANFRKQSRLTIVYTAFNYKDCFAGTDFLCNNLRCISILLRCDGLDHCGDNSDESAPCLDGFHNRILWSKRPNFLFQRIERYSDISKATFIFLACSLGLIGLIFAMAILVYRVNVRERHHRRIQDHIETIHAILEESVLDIEEEVIIPDEPPDYEAPPDYSDISKLLSLKLNEAKSETSHERRKSNESLVANSLFPRYDIPPEANINSSNISRGCQTIPDSPPPVYTMVDQKVFTVLETNDYLQVSDQSSSSSSLPEAPAKSTLGRNVTECPSTQHEALNVEKDKNSIKLLLKSKQSKNNIRCRYFSDSQLTYLYSDADSEMHVQMQLMGLKSYSSDDINFSGK